MALKFKPVQKRSLSSEVFDQIQDQILSGELQAGELLPSERQLCELFGVNRGAVREALKRLEQIQLVAIQHGGGTRVLDYRVTAGIEILPALLVRGGVIDLGVVGGVMELRASMAEDIALLCARRVDEQVLTELDRVTAEMGQVKELMVLAELNVQFWRLLIKGSNNIAYQLAYNALQKTFENIREKLRDALAMEWTSQALYREIYLAMRQKDAELARQLTKELVSKGTLAVLTILDRES